MTDTEGAAGRPDPLADCALKWDKILNSLSQPVWLMDGEQRILWANTAAGLALGRPPGDITGRYCYEVAHESKQPLPNCPFETVKRTALRESVEFIEGGRALRASMGPAQDAARGSGTIVHILDDITRGQYEEGEKRRLTSELWKKNSRMEDFLLTAAHDIRTPLLCIQGFSEHLEKDIGRLAGILDKKPFDEQARFAAQEITRTIGPESLEPVTESAIKIEQLVNSIIKVAKLGQVKMEPQTVDMEALIKRAVTSLAYQAVCAGADIKVLPLPPCTGDLSALSQIFTNLLDNAIKYRDTRHALQITIRAKEENGSVVYSMADNGIGIKEEGLPDIWRVFYSRPGPCSQKGEGIGLPMSRRLVEANRGRIWAESAEGKGSTFYVEMPR